MGVPYREFTQAASKIELLAAHCVDPDDNNFNLYTDWDNSNEAPVLKAGAKKNASGYELWVVNTRPDGDLVAGADVGCFAKITATMTLNLNDPALTLFRFVRGTGNVVWHPTLVTGRYYDGSNQWPIYPIYNNRDWGVSDYGDADITVSALPKTLTSYVPSIDGSGRGFFCGDMELIGQGRPYDDNLFNEGLWFWTAEYRNAGGDHFLTNWTVGHEFSLHFTAFVMRVHYFNPVVSTVSLTDLAAAGGETIVLTGLGFKNSVADIEEGALATRANGWIDTVKEIDFEGQEGQGITTITAAGGGFTVDSNTQITITTPALSGGTYHMLLSKSRTLADTDHETERIVNAYVGDWTVDGDGKMTAGTRTLFTVGQGTEFGRRWRCIDANGVLKDLWKMRSYTNASIGDISLVNMQTGNKVWTARLYNNVLRLHAQVEAEGVIRFMDSGGRYAGLKAPTTYASSVDYKFPTRDGTAGQVISTSGSGQLSWITVNKGNVIGPPSATDNAVARFDTTSGKILQNSVMILNDAGLLLLADTSNAKMTIGLTINQGANDDEILALKSSDVAHGCTTYAETDTFASMYKSGATQGGVFINAFTEASVPLVLRGFFTTDNTTKSTAGLAAVCVYGYKISGTGITNASADQNIFGIRTQRGGALETVFIVDEDGDTWQDWTATLNALTASLPVVTNASKTFVSLAYTGATSLRKNLGLETSDSPTFTDLTISAPVNIYALSHDSFAAFVANEHLPGIDEDLMTSNSDVHVPTQQSVKEYVTNWASPLDCVQRVSDLRYPALIPDSEVDTGSVLTKTAVQSGITNKTFDSPITDEIQLSGQSMIAASAANEGKLNYANDTNRKAVGGRALEIITKSPDDATYFREVLSNRQECIKSSSIITHP